jgi:alpha-galactosidase
MRLVRDLCLTTGLAGSTVCLMDVDEQRLDAVYRLCLRYADEVGTQLTLERTMDRRAALDGADHVVVTALAAGHHRLQRGWDLGASHGYRFGGSLHVMHDEAFWINFYQLRLFDSLAEDMLAVCPDAWLHLVANPVLAGITHLTRSYPALKVVGLCHGFSGVYKLAETIGLERDDITFEVAGVNHFVWLTHFSHRGTDAFPVLDAWIERESETYAATRPFSDWHGPKAIDLYRRFGVFPIGDTCTPGGGSWGWWYHVDAETEHRWRESPRGWYDDHFARGDARLAESKRLANDVTVRVTDTFPPVPSGEIMVPIIESIACDIPRVFVVNVRNDGDFVAGIPRDFAVEVNALVSRRGIQPIRSNGLPAPLVQYALRDRVAPVEVELEAYQAGSRELLFQLLLMDPWTRTEGQAAGLLDAILDLPFHAEMRQHYRA